MTYAERAILARKATKPWRVGHGNPAPYELLTGSGSMELLESSMQAMRELVLNHRKILFVQERTVRSTLADPRSGTVPA